MNEKDFVNNWIENIQDELKIFPDDFLEKIKITSFSMPGKLLILGNEIFGGYEILTVDKEVFYLTDDFNSAKYILYANRNLPKEIKIPIEKVDLINTVQNYENHLDEIFKKLRDDFKNTFPESQILQHIFTEIMNKLNLHRYRKEG
ncbi:MAG: hypothetical protein JW866_06720 [Ignavibacteriales bacterium]|nr:hypothetical protein [Ignavibacteriales bacterium]